MWLNCPVLVEMKKFEFRYGLILASQVLASLKVKNLEFVILEYLLMSSSTSVSQTDFSVSWKNWSVLSISFQHHSENWWKGMDLRPMDITFVSGPFTSFSFTFSLRGSNSWNHLMESKIRQLRCTLSKWPSATLDNPTKCKDFFPLEQF